MQFLSKHFVATETPCTHIPETIAEPRSAVCEE